MKVNSNVRYLKRNLIINIEPKLNQPDLTFLIEKWKGVIERIKELLEKGSSNFCYQELYQNINDLLLFNIPAQVVSAIEDIFLTHSKTCYKTLKEILLIQNINDYFNEFNTYWKIISENFNLLRKILAKFEKRFFSFGSSGNDNTSNIIIETNKINNYKYNSVWNLFLDNLKKEIVSSDNKFIQKFVERILNKISSYRDELYSYITSDNVSMENLNTELVYINEGVNFLWETNLYKEYFHDPFINNSTEFYISLGSKILNSSSIYDYIDFIEKSCENENKLITKYLNEFSLKKMIYNIEMKLILDKKNQILEKVFSDSNVDNNNEITLNEKKIEFLKKIFLMFKRVKIENDLKQYWLNYINSTANKIFKEFNKSYTVENFFDLIIKLKLNIDLTVKESFLNDEKFKTAAKEGYVKCLNAKQNSVADYFSRYINHILTEPDRDEKYILEKINEFMSIFKFLDAKDLFESFYIKKLSNRLLYNLSNSIKGEKYLIEKLRSECGNVFVTKSEEMLNDIENSAELTLNFKIEDKNIKKIENNFSVLSSYSWPITKIITGFVSNKINYYQNTFKEFYKAKFAGKALNWHLPYCTGELIYQINNKTIILEVNGIQAAILTKFTKKVNQLTADDLALLTIIEQDNLNQSLSSLTNNYPILVKENDLYKINQNFHPTKTHLIVNDFSNVNKEETSYEEIKEVEERNWEDRKHVIDAYIMKILKAKKQLKSNDVIQHVISSVKFSCDIISVNTRINFLISLGYISKDEKDEELIKYF